MRQSVGGEFEADAEIDEGRGPGGETGKHVIFAGGLTYARAQFAPWRERPTDHGRDARRFRDESFTMAGDLARLYGPALVLTPAGETQFLGRTARRFTVALAREVPVAAAGADPRAFAAGGARRGDQAPPRLPRRAGPGGGQRRAALRRRPPACRCGRASPAPSR